jgi:hypothetical protein
MNKLVEYVIYGWTKYSAEIKVELDCVSNKMLDIEILKH